MRVAGHTSGRFLGYVQVQVASRTYALRVEALPRQVGDGAARQTGFFADSANRFGIWVDEEAPTEVVEETIAQASAEAARHISRTLLN
jgi:hypothetical protein